MTWVKLDDQFFRHPKSRAAGKNGRALFLAGLCYCAGSLTDGFISADALPLVLAEAEVPKVVVRRLCDVGLWETVDGGWHVHNYEVRQRTRDEVENERAATRERVKKHRDKRAGNAVSNGKITESEVEGEGEEITPLVPLSTVTPLMAAPPPNPAALASVMSQFPKRADG